MTTKTKKSNAVQLLEKLAGRPLTIGGIIESIRLGEEVSQKDFAKKLKISPSHLCDIEKNRKVLSPERAARFAKILGYSERQFVQFAIQGQLDAAGIKMRVNLEVA